MMHDQPIVPVAPPWKLKGTVYMVNFYCKGGNLPEHAYSPLERESSFADAGSGKHLGGISQFQFIRYTESPVGPYDELIISPGFFQYEVEDDGGRRKVKRNARITRIYVSQKYTCWNGRRNWNIPKHLARFEWDDLEGGSTRVKVFPQYIEGHPTEAECSNKPLFQATFQPIKYTPEFPFSLSWAKYIGLDVSLVQPPLPKGEGGDFELPGTDRWCKIDPVQYSNRTRIGWVDLSQSHEQQPTATNLGAENFWPGIGRWQLGLKLENADVVFGESIYWDPPKSGL